jgi:hypothetical protein
LVAIGPPVRTEHIVQARPVHDPHGVVAAADVQLPRQSDMALAVVPAASDVDAVSLAKDTVGTAAGSGAVVTALSAAEADVTGTLKGATEADVVVTVDSTLTAVGTAGTEETCSGPASAEAAGAKLRTLAAPALLPSNLALWLSGPTAMICCGPAGFGTAVIGGAARVAAHWAALFSRRKLAVVLGLTVKRCTAETAALLARSWKYAVLPRTELP